LSVWVMTLTAVHRTPVHPCAGSQGRTSIDHPGKTSLMLGVVSFQNCKILLIAFAATTTTENLSISF
jgi:hypothetical protein